MIKLNVAFQDFYVRAVVLVNFQSVGIDDFDFASGGFCRVLIWASTA